MPNPATEYLMKYSPRYKYRYDYDYNRLPQIPVIIEKHTYQIKYQGKHFILNYKQNRTYKRQRNTADTRTEGNMYIKYA